MSGEQNPYQRNPSQQAEGEYIAQAQDDATAIVNAISYQHVRPSPVDSALLDEGRRLLETLPLNHVPETAPPLPGSVGSPMDPNPIFVGREEVLKELAATIKAGGSGASGPVKTVCIYGLGGVGKTQIASEFAHLYGRYFKGGVYWLNVSNPSAVAEEIAGCGGAGAMDLRGDFDRLPLEDQVRIVKSEWQNDLPRLLILDNCEGTQTLRACRPTTGECRVLLTRHGPFGDPALAVVSVELQVLDREASLELLRSRCRGIQMEENDLVAVAEELGDLPLALDLAGRFLYAYRNLVSPSEYVEELQAVEPIDHRSLRQSDGYSPTDHELDVGRTFVVSYERLNQDVPTDRLAIRLLARAAHFAPEERIERPLLLSTVENGGDSEEDSGEVPDAYQIEDALRRLTDLGLLSESENCQLRLHRLVASFARLEIEDKSAQENVERAVANEAMSITSDGHPVSQRSLLPHLRHMVEGTGDREDEAAYMVRFALSHAFSQLGSHAEAVPLLQDVVRYNTERLGATDWVTMRQRNDLAVVMNRGGDTDGALTVYETVLQDQERELGSDHEDVASTLNNIGVLLRDEDRLDEVLPIYERTLDIRKNKFGYEHRDTAESLHNLGALMIDLERYEDAWPYLERALQIIGNVMGPDHLDNVGPLVKMGFLLRREGKYTEARPCYERALEIRENALWPEHPDVINNLYELGALMAEQEAYEEAQPFLERLLQRSVEVYGEYNPTTAGTINMLAHVHNEQGHFAEARTLCERELAISERIMGGNHPQTAQCLNHLATALWHLSLYPEAQRHLERAVEINEQELGEHPATAGTLDNLGNVLSAQEAYQEARSVQELALTIRQRIVGEDHLDSAIGMNNLAHLLQNWGFSLHDPSLLAEALPYQQRALAIFERDLGDKHPHTARLLYFTAVSLQMLGRLDEARPYVVRALSASENVFGRSAPFTEMVRENLNLLDKG